MAAEQEAPRTVALKCLQRVAWIRDDLETGRAYGATLQAKDLQRELQRLFESAGWQADSALEEKLLAPWDPP